MSSLIPTPVRAKKKGGRLIDTYMEQRRATIARITTKTVFALCLFLAAAGAFVTGSANASAAPFDFLTNHQLYDRGEDIRSLQQFFNTNGFIIAQSGPGSPGNETSIFGLLTYRTLTEFQSAHGLPATGYFGPLTRGVINSGSAASNSAPTTVSQNTSPTNSVATATTTASTTPPLPSWYTKPLPGYAPGQIIFGGGSSAPAPISTPDTTPPTVSFATPSSGATVGGLSVTLTATASDNVAVANVQFKIDGANIGSAITSSPYTTTWNSTGVADGSHTLYAVAVDTSGNYATSSITVTVNNTAPILSSISTITLTTTATTTWTTDKAATSKIVYGTTSAYGSATSSAVLATSHSIIIGGLTSGTIYHYAVVSADGQGNTATSTDQTFEASPTTLPLDANGFTVFTPSPGTGSCAAGTYTGTCVIYVSNSTGNDSNDGLSIGTPVKTIAQGLSLIRAGFPDWLLLKKGDTWKDESFAYLHTNVDGRSASEPALISSYGTGARPLIKTNDSNYIGIGTGGAGDPGDFLAVTGLEFYAYTRDPNNAAFTGTSTSQEGVYFNDQTGWLLLEDNKFSFYSDNIAIQLPTNSGTSTVTIRRNVAVDSWSVVAHSQGLLTGNVANLVIEDNVFDHNGWNVSIAGADANIFSRNAYVQYTDNPIIFRRNISTNSSSEGVQLRSGGAATDNLFVQDSNGFDLGHLQGAPIITTGVASRNVILESKAVTNGYLGDGIDVYSASGSGVQVTNNIIANPAVPTGWALSLDSTVTGITANNNIIYGWNAGQTVFPGGSGNTTSPNAINQSGYANPNVSVESYDASLGGPGTLADFVSRASLQGKGNWNTALVADTVNNYIRAGFGQ